MTILLAAVLGYLLGSVPFGLVITKAAGLGDIRAIGSGNIGATNVLRTGRKDLAAATLLLDSGKGAIAVLIAYALSWPPEVAGAAAFLGHCFPVWLKFKGGKGVATFLGTLLALWLPAGAFACAIWLACAFLFRFSSLAALIAAAASPLALFAMGKPSYAIAALFMTALIFIRHRANIERLMKGEEPRIGAKKAPA
ncbi:MAG TPA: glycerol-3-phosphate acyltransferase [Parvularcula sp.]|nr:glycerol-3-phosphate acyltransferase [Parvularcula sp.]